MRRTVVGLLAAVGAAASGLIASAYGDLVLLVIAAASTAAGLAAYLALPPIKKNLLELAEQRISVRCSGA